MNKFGQGFIGIFTGYKVKYFTGYKVKYFTGYKVG